MCVPLLVCASSEKSSDAPKNSVSKAIVCLKFFATALSRVKVLIHFFHFFKKVLIHFIHLLIKILIHFF